MSYQDFNNGYNGNPSGTPDAGSNESFRRGVFQAQDDARHAELNDFISKGGLNGLSSGSGGSTSTGFKIIFYMAVSIILFFLMLLVGLAGLNIFVHGLSSSKPLPARIQHREPLKFHGYTLYSGPLHNKFIVWHLVDPNGRTIWRQPVSMDHEWTSEERPTGYITSDKCIHPGRIVFDTAFTGPKNEYAPYFLVLNHQGKVISFSDKPPRHKVKTLGYA